MDSALLAFLLDMAVKFSGLPAMPVEQLPPMRAVSSRDMRRIVCADDPASCRNLQAVFDTEGYRILYLDTLELENASDNSFLVHELVHVLQYRRDGDAIYADCRALLRTESQAYRAQNAYLQREGQLLRVGDMLRFTTCAEQDQGRRRGDDTARKPPPGVEPWRVDVRRPSLAASTWEHPVWQQ